MKSLTFFFLTFLTLSNACDDDDVTLAQMAAQNGFENLSTCGDTQVLERCQGGDQTGQFLRQTCCSTCAAVLEQENELPPTDDETAQENELPPTDETVQLFLLGGQSECVGGASENALETDSVSYPGLQGDIEGVWFAGYMNSAAFGEDSFFIGPMNAGESRYGKFGPEVSFGERVYSVTGQRTMIVKYCIGGTNVRAQWNPLSLDNTWDKDADDGTSQWMSDNANIVFQPKDEAKKHLFKTLVYTMRRTEEALIDGQVPFEWAGIIWLQGSADSDEDDPNNWKTFGENTARVWEGFREEIGIDVPVIDTGSSTKNQLKSGKEYAIQIVDGCNAITVEYAMAANDETSSDCIVTPTNPCIDAPNMHLNNAVFNYYGWDPNVPDELKPDDAVDKTFDWWVSFPSNMHSGYEGMILKGRFLANAYLREFANYELDDDIAALDPVIQFPYPRCEDGTLPSSDNLCWIDKREESLMEENLCQPVGLTAPGDNTGNEMGDDTGDNTDDTVDNTEDDTNDTGDNTGDESGVRKSAVMLSTVAVLIVSCLSTFH